MYSTCIFCNRPLGENTVLEEFPVGRRLAFDAHRGRLWVVCRRCERWNLSPLEERWEAIEAAERVFRDTRMRVSTENIGIARHAEGLELVRIGRPMRPEFAAWRYGDQFGRRRRRAILMGAGAAAVVGTVAIAGAVTGAITGAMFAQSGNFYNFWMNGRTLVRYRTTDGELLKLKRPDLQATKWRREGSGEWSLSIERKKQSHELRGVDAQRAAGLILPRLNSGGARASVVQEAVREIERAGHPEAYLGRIVDDAPKAARSTTLGDPDAAKLGKLPTPTRLALEMALHEEHERRALEGELELLESAWRSAEEIAAISDDLLIPEEVRERLKRAREETRPGAGEGDPRGGGAPPA